MGEKVEISFTKPIIKACSTSGDFVAAKIVSDDFETAEVEANFFNDVVGQRRSHN